MGRLSYEAKRERARNVLIETIAKIRALEPVLGGKWRANMLIYYELCLAELILHQSGFVQPSREAVEVLADKIREVLVS